MRGGVLATDPIRQPDPIPPHAGRHVCTADVPRTAKRPPNSGILRVRRTPDIHPHRGGTHHTRL